jgi:hypothetical protein
MHIAGRDSARGTVLHSGRGFGRVLWSVSWAFDDEYESMNFMIYDFMVFMYRCLHRYNKEVSSILNLLFSISSLTPLEFLLHAASAKPSFPQEEDCLTPQQCSVFC